MADPGRPQTPTTDHARRAHDLTASFFDELTDDVPWWMRQLENAARDAGLSGRRLLDVGCGTGESFLPMLARGYEVTACDISPGMLAQARRKAVAGRVVLVEQDMRELPRLGDFDLVWCIGGGLSYLRDWELVPAFAGMRENLAPGGILVVDVATLATFRSEYSTLRVRQVAGNWTMLDGRASSTLSGGGTAEIRIERLTRDSDGRWSSVRAVHHRRHHPILLLEAALARAGLELIARHGATEHGLVPGVDERCHRRAVIVARSGGQSDARPNWREATAVPTAYEWS